MVSAGVILAFTLMLTNAQKQTIDIDKIYLVEELSRATNEVSEMAEFELTDAEFEYLCKCVESEAGDQDYLGRCYVADVILNRIESDGFPNNVVDVINQKHFKNGKWHWQFEVVKNDRINSVKVTDETRKAVQEELIERKNKEMLFFCAYDWFRGWAEYMFKHDGHYFYK